MSLQSAAATVVNGFFLIKNEKAKADNVIMMKNMKRLFKLFKLPGPITFVEFCSLPRQLSELLEIEQTQQSAVTLLSWFSPRYGFG